MGFVPTHTGTERRRTTDVRCITPVGELCSLGKLVLHKAHGTSEIMLGLSCVHNHLVQKMFLQLLASSLVKGKVAIHLGTHGSHIALASGLLGSDLLLNVVKVIGEAHATIWGVCEHGSDLLHIGGIH